MKLTLPSSTPNFLASTYRAMLAIIILVIGFGQLLRIPTTRPDFHIQALDLLISLTALSFSIYRFLSLPKLFPTSWFGLTQTVLFSILIFTWLINPSWFSNPGAATSLFYLLRFYSAVTLIDVATFSLQTKQHLIDLARVFLMSFFLILIGGLIQYFLIPDFHFLQFWGWDNHLYRLSGQILDPGFTGLLIILGVLFLFPLYHFDKKMPSLWTFFCTLISISALALTFSRASYIAFAAALVMWVISTRKFLTPIALAVTLILAILLAPKPAGEGVNLARTSTVNFRFANWYSATEIFQQHPLLGVGFNRYRYVQYQYGFLDPQDWRSSHSAAGVDNSLLFLMVTTGIIGTVIFLTFTAVTLLILFRQKLSHTPTDSYFHNLLQSLPSVAIASLTTIFTHGMFHNSWFYAPALVWIAILIGMAFRVGKLKIES